MMAAIRRILGLDRKPRATSTDQIAIRNYVSERTAELDRLNLEMRIVGSRPPRYQEDNMGDEALQ